MWQTCIARVAKIAGAWGLLWIYMFAFDNILYPFVIFWWGPLVGGLSMATLASTLCLIQILWYEKTGVDWLGVNVVEDIKKNGSDWTQKLDTKAQNSTVWFVLRIILFLPSRFFKIILWAIKKNDILAFVALNINQDPFVTTVFLRHGRFDGLKRRDWVIFCLSLVFSNGYWIARNVVLIELVKLGWHTVT